MQTIVKKWIQDKDYGFLDNGAGPDIMVMKSDLLNCKFLKIGATVEFECHVEQRGLSAKKVKLNRQSNHQDKPHRFGVMT